MKKRLMTRLLTVTLLLSMTLLMSCWKQTIRPVIMSSDMVIYRIPENIKVTLPDSLKQCNWMGTDSWLNSYYKTLRDCKAENEQLKK